MRKEVIYTAITVIIIAIIFWSSVSLQDFFFDLVEVAQIYIEANPTMGMLAFLGLAAAGAILSPFSSVPIVPFVIPIWGEVLTFTLLTIGWLIGGLLAYVVGRYAGYPLMKKFFSFDKVEELKQELPKRSSFLLVLLFRLATPSEITSYFLGVIRFRFWQYFWATLISEFVFAVLTIYLSDAVIEKDPILLALWLAVLVGIMLGTYYYYKKIRKRTRN
tara:strand:- start:2669 stop:3322 length:654 start_codon:yes stop_codon:yes gene_type:complete